MLLARKGESESNSLYRFTSFYLHSLARKLRSGYYLCRFTSLLVDFGLKEMRDLQKTLRFQRTHGAEMKAEDKRRQKEKDTEVERAGNNFQEEAQRKRDDDDGDEEDAFGENGGAFLFCSASPLSPLILLLMLTLPFAPVLCSG